MGRRLLEIVLYDMRWRIGRTLSPLIAPAIGKDEA
jgi:hypothetical protein